MNAYEWMMLIVLLFAFVLKGNRRDNLKFIVIAMIAMFCIMALRDMTKIGNDSTSSYRGQFTRMAHTSWSALPKPFSGDFNFAFLYLMKLVSTLSGGSYQVFIILLSSFVLFSFGRFLKRYSVSPIQSICYYWGLLLYIFMFDALKQAIGMSILLYAFDAIIAHRPYRFYILTVLAGLFHFPALIFLPAYLISKMKIQKGYLLFLSALLVLTLLFRSQLVNLMLNAYSTEAEEFSSVSMTGMTFFGVKAITMLVIIMAGLLLRPPTNDDFVYSTLLKFMGIALILQTFCGYSNIFERLADYYFQFSVVFIPLVFEKVELEKPIVQEPANSAIKTVAPFLFSAYGVWRFSSYIIANSALLLPFRFFFQ